MEKEKSYYMVEGGKYRGKFARADKRLIYEKFIDNYNSCISESDEEIISAVDDILANFRIIDIKTASNEFLQVMVILLAVLEKRNNSRHIWTYNANVAFEYDDLEICRELVIHAIKKSCLSDVKNSNKQFPKLKDEDKDQNVADILEIITEELEQEGNLDESKCKELLEDFTKPLNKWRNLEVPKVKNEESYDLIYDMIQLCCKHKVYHTALRLAGLLLVADHTKELKKLSKTLFITGKILYELGYMEAAKRCFMFADEDTKNECWEGEEEKYHDLLHQDTRLEMNAELLEKLEIFEEELRSGKRKTYTEEERKRILAEQKAGTLEAETSEKQIKMRKKIGKKAIAKYEKYAQGSKEERLEGIDKAFAVFEEEPEVYEEAAYLYYLKANCYLTENNYETSYEYLKKAYNCKNGKRNGLVLLGIAIALSNTGMSYMSIIYLFRTYILCGKDFIIEKVGTEPWSMLEKYLK